MSVRGSSPKIASETVTEPEFLPSSDVIFSSMSHALLRFGSRGLFCRGSGGRGGCALAELELAGLWHAVRQPLLHRVTHRDPAAFDARHGAFDQDESAVDVSLHDFEIERGHAVDAEMAGHFLVLEGPAGILAPAGRADRAMRDGNAVARAQAAEIPALHAAGPALAGRGAGYIDILANDEMIRRDLGADRNKRVGIDAEFGELALGLDLGHGEVAAVGFGRALYLADAGAKLQGDIAVLLFGAMADDLAIGEAEHRDRHMLASLGEEAGHSDFLCEHPGTHW